MDEPVCPECGGRKLAPVRPDDLERPTPGKPPAMPGMLKCARCGTIVQYGPK